MVTLLLVGVVWTAGSSWNGNWGAKGAGGARSVPERPARASGWRGAEGRAPAGGGGSGAFKPALFFRAPGRSPLKGGRWVFLSRVRRTRGSGDARRGHCLAGPGVMVLLDVLQGPSGLLQKLCGFREELCFPGRRTCQPKVFKV